MWFEDFCKQSGGAIQMSEKAFVKEHKNLLKTLQSGDPKLLRKEYKEQKEELEKQLRKKPSKT